MRSVRSLFQIKERAERSGYARSVKNFVIRRLAIRRATRAYRRGDWELAHQVLRDAGVARGDANAASSSDRGLLFEPPHPHLVVGAIEAEWVKSLLAAGQVQTVRKRLASAGYRADEIDKAIEYFETEDSRPGQ